MSKSENNGGHFSSSLTAAKKYLKHGKRASSFMELKEKIGSLFMVGFDGLAIPQSLVDLIRNYFVRGVVLFRRNIKSPGQLKKLTSSIKETADGRPVAIAVDYEGGRVFRLPPPFTQLPPMSSLGDEFAKMGEIKKAYDVGAKMAEELRSVGININFAPVLDVNTNVKNPVIGDRAFSCDAGVVARLGCEVIKGLQDGGVVACGKHFPGHGDTSSDSHLMLPRLPHTIGRLEAVELIPFQSAIEAGLKSIMTAHVVYEGVDPVLPATLSPVIINRLLRHNLGFKGVVFTDDLNMKAISISLSEACIKALQAGCDICLICRDNDAQRLAIEHVTQAVAAGVLSASLIESAHRRVSQLFTI